MKRKNFLLRIEFLPRRGVSFSLFFFIYFTEMEEGERPLVIPAKEEEVTPEQYQWRDEMIERLHPRLRHVEILIQNRVYTGELGVELSLIHLLEALASWGIQWCPTRIIACVLRFIDPKVTFLLCKNGRIVCTGARDVSVLHEGSRILVKKLREIGYKKTQAKELQIVNIVANASLRFCTVDLERLHREHQDCVTYDPQQFPGAIIRHPDSQQVTITIFTSGCMVITGAKSKWAVGRAVLVICLLVQPYVTMGEIPENADELGIKKRKRAPIVAPIQRFVKVKMEAAESAKEGGREPVTIPKVCPVSNNNVDMDDPVALEDFEREIFEMIDIDREPIQNMPVIILH